jgi:hypothetical protein
VTGETVEAALWTSASISVDMGVDTISTDGKFANEINGAMGSPHPTLQPVRRRGSSGQHRARPQLLAATENASLPSRLEADSQAEDVSPARRCPCCGGRMLIVQTFQGPRPWRSPSPSRIRIDTS